MGVPRAWYKLLQGTDVSKPRVGPPDRLAQSLFSFLDRHRAVLPKNWMNAEAKNDSQGVAGSLISGNPAASPVPPPV